ncbi:MAG: hypothetical protein IJZ96_03960 [Lachnospiraceae bacterium]|nr:hypothetical protein [Lachnospiraceae bacterium]
MLILLNNMVLALLFLYVGIFTFKGAVMFYILEFVFYILFFYGRYVIEDDDINLEDIEDEELREEIRLYKDGKRVNKEKINKD